MNDIEVLGLEIKDYSKYKTKKNNNEEMIHKIEQINIFNNNYKKYHTYNPIVTEKDYDKDVQFFIVSHDFGQLDWMGYGYRKKTFITSKTYKDVLDYCKDKYGENHFEMYYNIKYFNYDIKKVSIKEYLIEINKILNKVKEYEELKCINYDWKLIGMKLCVSKGIPVRMKNGQIEYEGQGELERYYKPDDLDEVRL